MLASLIASRVDARENQLDALSSPGSQPVTVTTTVIIALMAQVGIVSRANMRQRTHVDAFDCFDGTEGDRVASL